MMNRKDFLKLGTTGLFSSTVNFTGSAATPNLGDDWTDPGSGNVWERTEFLSQKAMVCTSQPLAVAAGCEILKKGGNAIDAAIAANAMLSLTEPMMCGPGGDLFAIVWLEKEQKLYGLNASGRSPYDWSITKARKMGLRQLLSFGPLSWSVPGCVSGWQELQRKFGSKSFEELLQPAIQYAIEGFPVTEVISKGWKPEPGVIDYATLEGTYLFKGKGPAKGDFFSNRALAKTFQIIAKEGPGSFYEGEIAERIIRFSSLAEGRFSKKDFADHTASWIEPVSTNYRGYDVWQLPPNGQGLVVLQMLNVLENFDLQNLQPGSAAYFHLFLEAKKLCFEDRAVYYADNDFVKTPIAELLDKEMAAQRARLIKPNKARQLPAGRRVKNSSNTVYVATADDQGNMVSLIQSLYSPWGSHCVVDELGFALQNRGRCFSLNEKAWNCLEPHKRPFHTIIPAFVTLEGKPVFTFGVTGGDFQPQGQVQILMNLIDFHMPVQQAGNQLRLWHRESFESTGEAAAQSGNIVAEPGFPEKVMRKLEQMGHSFNDQTRFFGGYQGIWRRQSDLRLYLGASDCRKDGCAFGF